MIVNLQEFWFVQECSGSDYSVFATEADAQAAIDRWNDELNETLEQWEAGESSSNSLIQSQLEPDLEGGCYYSYHINPAFRPSDYYHMPPFKATYKVWGECPGANRITWGNPATARMCDPKRANDRIIAF